MTDITIYWRGWGGWDWAFVFLHTNSHSKFVEIRDIEVGLRGKKIKSFLFVVVFFFLELHNENNFHNFNRYYVLIFFMHSFGVGIRGFMYPGGDNGYISQNRLATLTNNFAQYIMK